jgi:TP901 family phage tail tape measure protein
MNNMGLGFVFTAHDLASAKMQGLERSFQSLDRRVGLGTERISGSFRELGMGLAIMTTGAAMVGGAFALADKAGQFEQAIAAVAAVSGATTDELAQLRNAAIDAGIATQFSPTEATVGLKELAQAGFNAQESMKLLIPVLDLAGGSLGELTPAQAAGLASQALKAFGVSADDAAIAVDRMLQAVNVFALNASELPMALGNASRGAQALHQSMSETLIALGLVKNIIPGVERASTGVAVAMERMADPKTQTALKGIGVQVTDSGGHFRNFLDVIGEMGPALDKMTDAKRSAFLIDTFGAHALGSLQAILTQVTNGIRTNTGETLKGSDAVAYLRKQFEGAGGTAATFRDKMLDTFAGQKQLLRGSLETLAIVLGEPFAQVFKPILATVIDGLNGLLKFIRAMPAGLKKALGSFFVGAGAILTIVGAAIAAKAGLALLVIALKAAGVTLGGVIAVLLPAIVVIAAIGLTVAGLGSIPSTAPAIGVVDGASPSRTSVRRRATPSSESEEPRHHASRNCVPVGRSNAVPLLLREPMRAARIQEEDRAFACGAETNGNRDHEQPIVPGGLRGQRSRERRLRGAVFVPFGVHALEVIARYQRPKPPLERRATADVRNLDDASK